MLPPQHKLLFPTHRRSLPWYRGAPARRLIPERTDDGRAGLLCPQLAGNPRSLPRRDGDRAPPAPGSRSAPPAPSAGGPALLPAARARHGGARRVGPHVRDAPRGLRRHEEQAHGPQVGQHAPGERPPDAAAGRGKGAQASAVGVSSAVVPGCRSGTAAGVARVGGI